MAWLRGQHQNLVPGLGRGARGTQENFGAFVGVFLVYSGLEFRVQGLGSGFRVQRVPLSCSFPAAPQVVEQTMRHNEILGIASKLQVR